MIKRIAVVLAAALLLSACGSDDHVDSGDFSEFTSSTGGEWRSQGEGVWKLDIGAWEDDQTDDLYARCLPSGSLAIVTYSSEGGMGYVLDGCVDGHPK